MTWNTSVARKAMIGTALYLSLLALAYVLVPNLIHRKQFDLAFDSWRKNPSSQNEALLRTQQHRNMIIQPEGSAIGALVLWVAGFASYRVVRSMRR